MENKFAKKLSLTIPKVTIPEEARRPFYATVGAAEVAVERVRGAVATMQIRAVDTQKNLSDKTNAKFGELVGDNVASASKAASTAYAEFTRRGEETVGRIWPDAVAKTEAPAKVAKPRATTKTAPKKPGAAKAAPKATATKTNAPKAAAPKATAPKVTAPMTVGLSVAETTADKPASE